MRSRGRVSPPASWLCALSLLTLCLRAGGIARAGVLDPSAFTSLGSLNLSAGSVVINTDTLSITGAASFTGVIYDQGSFTQNGVADFDRQVAVFDFSNINLGALVNLTITGSRPLALLSRGNLTITPAVAVNGGNAGGTFGGSAGVGGGAGGVGGFLGTFGTGPGIASAFVGITHYDGGGAGFGANGSAGGFSSYGGVGYGSIQNLLQGGSSGGGASDVDFASAGGGGGGGGAIELGAIGAVTLTGGLNADGGAGGDASYYGGGGSGGGVMMHGSTITFGSTVTARGGNAGYGGGAGGGGRMLLAPDSITATSLQLMLATVSVNGGLAGLSTRNGFAGVLTLRPGLLSIGAGQSITFSSMATGQTSATDPRIDLLPTDLTIASGGSATANTANAFYSPGIMTINGTLLLGSNTQSVAALNGSGRVQIGSGATLSIGTGNFASVFSGTLDGGGSVSKVGNGEFSLTGGARLNATLTLGGGTLTISTATASIGSAIVSTGGAAITVWNNSTATFGGNVTTNGTVTVTGGSKAIFNAALTTPYGVTGTGSVQINGTLVAGTGPASLNFGGDLGLGSLSSTKLEIGGSTAGTQRDLITVGGTATLGGELRVGLINGFLPTPGSTFEIMTFGARSGDISVLASPGSTGLALTKNYTANSLMVTINPGLIGDANYDGLVNSADLGRLALSWGGTGNWTNGDFSGDGRVDLRDLVILATHWQSAAPGADLAVTLDELGLPPIVVPEPSALTLIILLAALMTRRQRRDAAE